MPQRRCARMVALAAMVFGTQVAAQAPVQTRPPLPTQISIETTGKGNLIIVDASDEMQVEARTVWDAVTDYDNLAEFIPDMRVSRVVQREGNTLLVEKQGEFRFLLFRQPVDVRMKVIESPQRRVVARAVGGNVRALLGVYAIESLPEGTVRPSYSGRLIPDFPVPPLIGVPVVRRVLAKQVTAPVDEIVRRDRMARSDR
ncbi:SRPBCC family protein [Variovorax rhizosphaerae]|uniref:SRPBCC family protein n=1 Tax=Variovorax rhizosphaerae TaxID=1836200 RepID=A0ABU8WJK6_9BURK